MACLLALFCGCGNKHPSLVGVKGIVKADGETVSDGQIMFLPTGGGRPASGPIGPDGQYELTSFKKGDGVPPGSYKVTINVHKTVGPDRDADVTDINDEAVGNDSVQKLVWVIPQKYSSRGSTTLKAEVKAGEDNEINFDSADFDSE